jgi:hypothetical protein
VRTQKRSEERREADAQARARAEAARDEAVAERDEARAQRDEVLLAYRALERQADSRRARDARGDRTAPEAEAEPEAEPEPARKPRRRPPTPPDGSEEPIGVRVMPATRLVGPDLHRTETRERRVSTFDLWAIRALGTAAAVCFILLLVMLLRVIA